jgi:hypothetical protein
MQFKTQLVVLGAKSSKGEYNGRPFNSTTVFYQAQLQEVKTSRVKLALNISGVLLTISKRLKIKSFLSWLIAL